MNLPEDPIMLLSFVNTNLRDYYASLEDFCDAFDVAPEEITEKLAAIRYTYDADANRFR
ncbi:MAG: DUF4250 domain-containing protein [Lachnospiraceae bacterium]|nr:DUF4250 domain-containing protein [Lachnospiraceae bacterium]